jgi:hypothetical protein
MFTGIIEGFSMRFLCFYLFIGDHIHFPAIIISGMGHKRTIKFAIRDYYQGTYIFFLISANRSTCSRTPLNSRCETAYKLPSRPIAGNKPQAPEPTERKNRREKTD